MFRSIYVCNSTYLLIDEGEWRRTAEQGAEHFMAKWIAADKTRAGLRHAVVCPNVTGRTKERIAQSALSSSSSSIRSGYN